TRHYTLSLHDALPILVHVPYKGSGQSMQDLLGGQHLVAFDTMPASAPHVRSGKLRAVAVSTAQRVPSFPEVPTAEEAGVPGYVRSEEHTSELQSPEHL